MISWDEFVNGQNAENIPSYLTVTNIRCPACGEALYKDTSVVLTTYPAKCRYECVKCRWFGLGRA